MSLKFELRPVHDALFPQYPGMGYTPPDDGETAQPVRIRRVPACISLICIFLLSFGLMLSAASCNKDDGSGDSVDGDIEEADGDADGDADLACTGDENICIDEHTARICLDGKLEEVDCGEYCPEYENGQVSEGCYSNNARDNICGCYDVTAGVDSECIPEDSYCLSDDVLNSCTESEWEWEEVDCAGYCYEEGKSSAGCVTPEEGLPYCDCIVEDCDSQGSYCVDENYIASCVNGKLEIRYCDAVCFEKGQYSKGCLNDESGQGACDCYSSCEGDCEECYPGDGYCKDENNLMDCTDYYWQELDCAAKCEEQGLESNGCVAPEDGQPYCDCVEAPDGDDDSAPDGDGDPVE